jgi:hypothetical protein
MILLVNFLLETNKRIGFSLAQIRFRAIISSFCDMPTIEEGLDRLGMNKADIGNHSSRKGVKTYILNCTTNPPSASSCDIRGGWSRGLKESYEYAGEPGDCYVGRLSCGLPRHSTNFALLPPFFKDTIGQDFGRCPRYDTT